MKDTWLNPGDKIYMVNGKDSAPGGWATNKQYTSLEEARKDLALIEDFTNGKGTLVIQEYTVKTPIPVREGYAGPITSKKDPGESYPGGGLQWELLLDKSSSWENFLTRTSQDLIK